MLPTPPIRVWSSSARLTSVCRRRRAAEKPSTSKALVERVDRDVRQPGRDPARHCSSTASPPKVRWSTKRSSRPPSVKVNRARRCVSSGWRRLLDEQLAAHAQVGDQGAAGGGAVGLGQRQPQVLAAAVGVGERAPGQRGDEVLGALEVPADGARVVDLDGRRRCGRRPTAPGRAGRPRPRAARARRQLSVRVRQAASAASCSAAFFVRPLPLPVHRPGEEDGGGEGLGVVGTLVLDLVAGSTEPAGGAELLEAGLPVQAGAAGRGLDQHRVEQPVDDAPTRCPGRSRGGPPRSAPRGRRRGSSPSPGRRWSPRRGRAAGAGRCRRRPSRRATPASDVMLTTEARSLASWPSGRSGWLR